MPYNQPIDLQDTTVKVAKIAYLVDILERLDQLEAVAKRKAPDD